MITDTTPRYMMQGTNIPSQEDLTISQFANAYRQSELIHSPRAEKREVMKTTNIYLDELLKKYPQQKEVIEAYGESERDFGQVIGGYAIGEDAMVARLRRQSQAEMFDKGRIYMDEDGAIQSNVPHLNNYVEKFQDTLKQYWQFRQLTDGTEFDINTLDAKNVARVQDELIELQQRNQNTMGSAFGTMAFGLTEPEILATFFTGGGSVGAGILGNASKSFAIEASASMMSEAMMQPKILEWRRKLYDPAKGIEIYTTWDAVKGALINSAFAGGLRATGSVAMDVNLLRKSDWNMETFKTKDGLSATTLKDDLKRSFADNTHNRGEDFSELAEETANIIQSSPEANIDAHVDNLNRTIQGDTLDGEVYKQPSEAVVNDFIVTPEGGLARVVSMDAEKIDYMSKGELKSIGRSETSYEPILNDVNPPKNPNHFDVEKRMKMTDDQVALVEKYSHDDEIKKYTTNLVEIEDALIKCEGGL